MPAIDLLAKMQATRIHLALVIDEYGGTDGLVSMEDIVELIVGDIADEHDEDETPAVVRQSDGSFLADARASLEDVTSIVGAEFDVGDAAEDVDTLGGYLVTKVGRVPVRGELVPGPGLFEVEVLDADPRRVKKVKIYRSKTRRPERSRDLKRREGLPSFPNAPSTSAEHPATADGARISDAASVKDARRS
jgi:CBS domain containing-hemolysin-like protein